MEVLRAKHLTMQSNKFEYIIYPEDIVKLLQSENSNFVETGIKAIRNYYKYYNFNPNDTNQAMFLQYVEQLLNSSDTTQVKTGYKVLNSISKKTKESKILEPFIDIIFNHIETFPSNESIFATKSLIYLAQFETISFNIIRRKYIDIIKGIYNNDEIPFETKFDFLRFSFDVISKVLSYGDIISKYPDDIKKFITFSALVFRMTESFCLNMLRCINSIIKSTAMYDSAFKADELDIDLNSYIEEEINDSNKEIICLSLNTLCYYYLRGNDSKNSSFLRMVELIVNPDLDICFNALLVCQGLVNSSTKTYQILGEVGLYDNLFHVFESGNIPSKRAGLPIVRSIVKKEDQEAILNLHNSGVFTSLCSFFNSSLQTPILIYMIEVFDYFFKAEINIGEIFPARQIFYDQGCLDVLDELYDSDNTKLSESSLYLKETYFNDV